MLTGLVPVRSQDTNLCRHWLFRMDQWYWIPLYVPMVSSWHRSSGSWWRHWIHVLTWIPSNPTFHLHRRYSTSMGRHWWNGRFPARFHLMSSSHLSTHWTSFHLPFDRVQQSPLPMWSLHSVVRQEHKDIGRWRAIMGYNIEKMDVFPPTSTSRHHAHLSTTSASFQLLHDTV